MPMHNSNSSQPTTSSISEDTSAHITCPLETENISNSSWRQSRAHSGIDEQGASPVAISTGSSSSSVHSPVNRVRDNAPSHPEANTEPAPMDSTSNNSGKKQMTGSEEESLAGRMTPDSESSSCSPDQTTTLTTPSTSALLSYEFSSVRVSYSLMNVVGRTSRLIIVLAHSQ